MLIIMQLKINELGFLVFVWRVCVCLCLGRGGVKEHIKINTIQRIHLMIHLSSTIKKCIPPPKKEKKRKKRITQSVEEYMFHTESTPGAT